VASGVRIEASAQSSVLALARGRTQSSGGGASRPLTATIPRSPKDSSVLSGVKRESTRAVGWLGADVVVHRRRELLAKSAAHFSASMRHIGAGLGCRPNACQWLPRGFSFDRRRQLWVAWDLPRGQSLGAPVSSARWNASRIASSELSLRPRSYRCSNASSPSAARVAFMPASRAGE
jgi:hypothetical protein